MPSDRGEHWTASSVIQLREVRKPITIIYSSAGGSAANTDIKEPAERGEHWTASSINYSREVRKPIAINTN